jgi:hypothetical protein
LSMNRMIRLVLPTPASPMIRSFNVVAIFMLAELLYFLGSFAEDLGCFPAF